MKFGEAVCQRLVERGVDTVFGIPGVHTLELFRGADTHGLRTIVPRHEQGAGFMADGYVRTTGKPGVCFLVTGPGVLNALTPVAQAWHDSQPMLVIGSTVASDQVGKHRGVLHDTPDVADTLRPYCLLSRNISTIDELDQALAEAFEGWATSRPRPVYLGIPIDVLESEVGELPPLAVVETAPKAPSPAGLDRAIRELESATAPVIIAGGGARHAAEAVVQLAEQLDAPLLSTANSKAIIAPDHPLALGLSAPFAGTYDLLASADAVLAIGTELSEVDFIFTGVDPAPLHGVIRVDVDPTATHPDQRDPAIVSDAAAFADAMLERLGDRRFERGGAQRVETALRSLEEARAADPYREWVAALETGIPANALIAADSAQLAYQAHQFLALPEGAEWLSPYGFGTLGPAIPMAVGAAVGNPDRPVIALAGDGSSLFTIPELATAADLGRQLTVVLWLNSGYMEIESSFERADITPVGVATSAPDFAAIASGLGARVETVTTPADFTAVLHTAVEAPELTVILITAPADLHVSPDSRDR